MGNRVKTKTVNLGRLPVYCGEWKPNILYHKYNIVTFYGSSFINIVEGNNKAPVLLEFETDNLTDSSVLSGYSLRDSDPGDEWTGWLFVANSLDASIYMYNEVKNYIHYEDNPEFVRVYTDNEDKVLWGIKTDGDIFFGYGVPSQIQTEITAVQNQVDNIIVNQSEISLTANPNVIYTNDDTDISIKFDSNVDTIGKIDLNSIYKDGSQIPIGSNTDSHLEAYTSLQNVPKSDIKFKSNVIINGIMMEDECYVYARDPIYYGSFNDPSISENKASARISPSGSYTIDVASNLSYVYFDVPEYMDINKATMNGYQFPFEDPVTITRDGQAYKSYKSKTTYDAGELTIVLS